MVEIAVIHLVEFMIDSVEIWNHAPGHKEGVNSPA